MTHKTVCCQNSLNAGHFLSLVLKSTYEVKVKRLSRSVYASFLLKLHSIVLSTNKQSCNLNVGVLSGSFVLTIEDHVDKVLLQTYLYKKRYIITHL